MHRRFLTCFVLLALIPSTTLADEPAIDIGSRRELFIDDYLVGSLVGEARRVLHHPTAREVSMVFDKPWEGSGCGYHSVFQDGDLYRMYYRGWQLDVRSGKSLKTSKPVQCYAESRDGIHWTRPELGLFEFNGSKKNNIILDADRFSDIGADPAHVAIFKDANPNCPADARYKAIVRSRKAKGLLPFKSSDGLRWFPMATRPVITQGAFDSQNLAFWDTVRGEYRAYYRDFRDGLRDIKTTTSKDFLTWSEPQWLEYPGAAKDQLYTNQIKPYYRAPHIFVGFPTRYLDRGWSESMKALPEPANRELRAAVNRRYGTAMTEGLLMSSRDGRRFDRWAEAFLRPGPQRPGTWSYGHQYIAWQLVETPSQLKGAANELSIYASEGYWTGASSRLRRYTLRIDGFASINAPWAGGELVTKPLIFNGERLEINFATAAAGSVRVEVQNAAGAPIEGFALSDCPELFGDELARIVSWKGGGQMGKLAGKPVRLRFVLKDADLYSLRFQ